MISSHANQVLQVAFVVLAAKLPSNFQARGSIAAGAPFRLFLFSRNREEPCPVQVFEHRNCENMSP